MSLTILEASAREVLEAYREALLRDDVLSEQFWRPIVIERLVMMHGAIEHFERLSGTDSAEQEGR